MRLNSVAKVLSPRRISHRYACSKSPVIIPYLTLFIFSFTELILHCTSMMIDTISLFHQQANCRMEEDEDSLAAILGLALLGAPFPFRSIRTYHTCKDLAGHPRISSPWLHLQYVGNNRAFITTMGIDVRTFEMLLIPFSNIWDTSTIDRADVNPHGAPQPHW